jgi:hypothetical protein
LFTEILRLGIEQHPLEKNAVQIKVFEESVVDHNGRHDRYFDEFREIG